MAAQPKILVSAPRAPAWIPMCLAGMVSLSVLEVNCSGRNPGQPTPAVTVQVASAERTKIEQQVVADAVVYPLHQSAIVPKISAPVSKFYVNRGSHVHAGELLAELEHQDLAAAVTENKGAYEQAEATYQTAVKAGLPEAMQKAQLDVKAAQQSLDAQQKLFDGRRMLYQQGAIPRKDLEDAGVALTQARNQYEIARKRFDSLKSFGNQEDLKAAQGVLAAAQGKYAAAKAQLSYSQVRSPIDGVVTDRPLYPGEMASAGSPLITVMDLSRIVARAHVTRQQAELLKVGDAATIAEPGAGGGIPAKITVVSPALDPNSTTVEVWVEAANSGERLKPGSSVRATMVAETVPDALVIPAGALLTASDGTTSVIVAGSDNKPQQKTVKAGIRQGDEVQITEGLQEGDRVVTAGAYELSQEDPDVLAKTKLEIQKPKSSSEGSGKD